MIHPRRQGREAALQLLFASDIEGQLASGQNRQEFWNLCRAKPAGREFAEELVNGVLARLPEIDEILAGAVENYSLQRVAAVDRNLLRIAVYELLFVESMPPAVAINEAIEIAKEFGTPQSPSFVNGILDRIRRERVLNTES